MAYLEKMHLAIGTAFPCSILLCCRRLSLKWGKCGDLETRHVFPYPFAMRQVAFIILFSSGLQRLCLKRRSQDQWVPVEGQETNAQGEFWLEGTLAHPICRRCSRATRLLLTGPKSNHPQHLQMYQMFPFGGLETHHCHKSCLVALHGSDPRGMKRRRATGDW